MHKFSIGYNHEQRFIEMIPLAKEHISEVYFAAPYDITSSGRAVRHEKEYEDNIRKIIEVCKENSIESNLLLNATCEGEDSGDKVHADKIIAYVKELQKIGLTSVSVTNPIHISRIKKEVPEIKIHSSVNCYVKNVEHAKYLRELGVDVITIDRDINRDIELIKKIKSETGAKIKVLLNEGCLRNCPYRHAHFNMISHVKDTDYFDSVSCINIYKKHPEKVFSVPFIRPEDLKKYEGIVDYYKLATRTTPLMKIPFIIDAYSREKFNGNLIDILSTKGLFGHFRGINNKILNESGFSEKLWGCDNECEKCDYCRDLLKKATNTIQ